MSYWALAAAPATVAMGVATAAAAVVARGRLVTAVRRRWQRGAHVQQRMRRVCYVSCRWRCWLLHGPLRWWTSCCGRRGRWVMCISRCLLAGARCEVRLPGPLR